MKKRTIIIELILVAALIGLWWWLSRGGPVTGPDFEQLRQIARNAADTISETAKEVSAPPPLRAKEESPTANLTRDGVLAWTNAARRDNGALGALTPNAELDAAAEAKLKDMFDKQYFEHVSPSGIGPSDLAMRAGYAFLSVGENLALGNYADDQALVQAWMDSPGHRANILGNYDEIGIAVGRGTYEGSTTWLAVQEFGRPLSACTQPDKTLQAKIDANKARLAILTAQAETLHAELAASKKPRTREQVDAYNAKVREYNAVVDKIDVLSQQTQGEVTVYNGQVQAFNACAQQ